MRIARSLILPLAVLSSACARRAAPTPDVLSTRVGVYRFEERAGANDETIRGRAVITPDSVIVEAEPGPCRYDVQTRPDGPITYRCANTTTLWFDRYDPVHRSTYQTTHTVMDTHQVCDRYGSDAQGRKVCVQQHTETTEHQASSTGTLHLIVDTKSD